MLPRCDVKVGHFNWSGCQAVGAWVTPRFTQSGKVDVADESGGGGTTAGPGETPAGVFAAEIRGRLPVRRPSAGGGGK